MSEQQSTETRPAPDPLTPVLSDTWDADRSWTLASYLDRGGYAGLRAALGQEPGDVVATVKASGLRGRGGAGFPTGMKWGFLPAPDGGPRYLVVNADESEPGTCKDIPLMLASRRRSSRAWRSRRTRSGATTRSSTCAARCCCTCTAACCARSRRRTRRATSAGRARVGLRPRRHGPRRGRRVHLRRGDGAARLARGPPRAAAAQAAVPRGRGPVRAADGREQRRVDRERALDRRARADWFTSMGTERSAGVGLFSLSGHVTRPGQYEAPLGTTLRELLDLAGGMRGAGR